MSRKSRIFLGMACAALVVVLASRLVPAFSSNDISDFATGLAAALMVGVLITWKSGGTSHS